MAATPLTPAMVTDVEFRARLRALGGRAVNRIGRGKEYVAHERRWGAAAARRRRQMAKRGLYGCASCEQWTPAARLFIEQQTDRLFCEECAIASGISLREAVPLVVPGPADAGDHELHQWEGEGGAPV